jgi:single-strand DNA-binding protein|tara:strand:+ start:1222 stop:1671 length:450 start_codon:yes stop_codon:yes gene_type:complete
MNIFTFTGNLGKDCEIGKTKNGGAMCKFSVAVKSGFGDNQKTNWINCRIYGKRAETALPNYLLKGTQVAISGELELAEWESNGTMNKALMLAVKEIDLIGGKSDQQAAPQQRPQAPQQQYQQQPQQYQQQAPQQAPQGMDSFDDDIPFN